MEFRARSEPPPAKKEQKEKKERTWTMKETIDWQNKKWKNQSWKYWTEPDPNTQEEKRT